MENFVTDLNKAKHLVSVMTNEILDLFIEGTLTYEQTIDLFTSMKESYFDEKVKETYFKGVFGLIVKIKNKD